MNKIIKPFIFFILILILVTCEMDYELDESLSHSLLVMNSLIENDHEVLVRLTESKSILESDLSPAKTVKDAEILLYVNDEKLEKLSYKDKPNNNRHSQFLNDESFQNGFYISDYKPKSGDNIYIVALDNNFPKTSASLRIPESVPIISLERVNNKIIEGWRVIDDEDFFDNSSVLSSNNKNVYVIYEKFDLRVIFQDEAFEKNFYRTEVLLRKYYDNQAITEERIKFMTKNEFDKLNYQYNGMSVFSSNDKVFRFTSYDHLENVFGLNVESNPFLLFTDEYLDGLKYNLNFNIMLLTNIFDRNNSPVFTEFIPTKQEIIVNLYHITEGYYKYLQTVTASQNREKLFSEPVQIYTNIDGGVGMVGGLSKSSYIFEIPRYGFN